MRILAFDPGFERLGAAVVERVGGKECVVYSTCIRTPKDRPFPERLRLLGERARGLMEEYAPDAIALEKVYVTKNQKTAMQVAEVRGVLIYESALRSFPLFEYTPLEVKVAVTGFGGSDKRQVGDMVARILSLPPAKRLDDELDAIAIGLTCIATYRRNILAQ